MTERTINETAQTVAHEEPTLFAQSVAGRAAADIDGWDVPRVRAADKLGDALSRDTKARLPEVSEPQVIRHFTRLSQWNFSIDAGFYPLGSCTMKYNPRLNESAARLDGFARLHPYMPESSVQGALELMHELEGFLCAVSGLHACTLQPAAGAQGELAGLMCIRHYHEKRGDAARTRVLVPDTAHGTNPASSALNGYSVTELPSGPGGLMTPEAVRDALDEDVAALMVTNPNTLGLFETNIREIADLVHEAGGLIYLDGANMNAILGRAMPARMGIDVMHFNLHKTFSTPHGGGGPGAGPICVTKDLAPFLPRPRIVRHDDGTFAFDHDAPDSIGRLKAFYGNFLVLVRAYTYIRTLGAEGLRRIAELAVLNANYLRVALAGEYALPFDDVCMHECVFSDAIQQEHGVSTMDIAKRLIDYGFHPPTVYFPLNVKGALMVEPTENESRDTLDRFIGAMRMIAAEAREDAAMFAEAPTRAFRRRLDEAHAARQLKLSALDED